VILADPLQTWINLVFDHPVTDLEWYWSPEVPAAFAGGNDWHEAPENIVNHIAETFENASELLSRFSDQQLDQGFWFLFGNSRPDFMRLLLDPGISFPIRLRAMKSFVPLFEQVMAARCSRHLAHLDEPGANPLNSACYMWLDELLDRFRPAKLSLSQLDRELISVLGSVLNIPHDACRESALHGIGHWVGRYPELAVIVDKFLSGTPGLRPELAVYAERARAGNVL
jgi:hypothetical protein